MILTSKNRTIPTISFTHSPELEARRILFVAGSLARGWYQKHDFLVLPALEPHAPASQVVFPNLPYSSIPRFWDLVSKLKLTTPQTAPNKLLNSAISLITPNHNLQQYLFHLSKLEEQYNQVKDNFWNNFYTLYPQHISRVKEISIVSTSYGSVSSFSLARSEQSSITIYIRQDVSIDKLLWSILASVLRPKMQDELKYSWEEIEAVIDHLLSETSLSSGLPHPHPTLKNLRSDQLAQYRLTSTQYLERLGINTVLKLTKVNNLYRYGDTLIVNLTKKEEMLLDLFLTKRGLTVSYEEIASVLWPNNDDWSLYALSKEIQRLRDKIKSNGINTRLIHAHRKLGYSIN